MTNWYLINEDKAKEIGYTPDKEDKLIHFVSVGCIVNDVLNNGKDEWSEYDEEKMTDIVASDEFHSIYHNELWTEEHNSIYNDLQNTAAKLYQDLYLKK